MFDPEKSIYKQLNREIHPASEQAFQQEEANKWKMYRDAKIGTIGVLSMVKSCNTAKLNFAHEKQVDPLFINVPDLLEYKKDVVVDLDELARRNMKKTLPSNRVYQNKQGKQFGLIKRFDWESPQMQSVFPVFATD